jgi:hypothetical protein
LIIVVLVAEEIRVCWNIVRYLTKQRGEPKAGKGGNADLIADDERENRKNLSMYDD